MSEAPARLTTAVAMPVSAQDTSAADPNGDEEAGAIVVTGMRESMRATARPGSW